MTQEQLCEQLNAAQFHYLLSKGFDLFGLIPAGLAIDATTVNQPTQPTGGGEQGIVFHRKHIFESSIKIESCNLAVCIFRIH
jgi:hypothetical protein